jgi:hypothetical protein
LYYNDVFSAMRRNVPVAQSISSGQQDKETCVTTHNRSDRANRAGSGISSAQTDGRESRQRRQLIALAGAAAGATLLGTLPGCGGGNSGSATPASNADPIWGANGAAAQIIASLQKITQSMFPSVDFVVTSHGVQPCGVVAATNPFAASATSPTSPGAEQTTAAGAYDSRPAFLAAIAACSAAGGGRVVVPAGTWYCAGPTSARTPPTARKTARYRADRTTTCTTAAGRPTIV